MTLDHVQVHLVDDIDTAFEFTRWLSTKSEVAFDTETSGLDVERDKVRLVQYGDADQAWVIPFERWSGLVHDAVRRYQGTYEMWNAPYDVGICRSNGVELPISRVDDSRLRLHVVEPTGSLALKNFSKREIDPRADWGQQKLDEAIGSRGGWTWGTVPYDFEPYWFYAGLDTILTMRAKELLAPRVAAEAPRSYELELAVAWVAAKMQRNGVRVDREYTSAFRDSLTEFADEADRWCRQHYKVSPGSDVKVAQALVDAGVELVKRTPRGDRFSVDKQVLSSLDHPLAQTVLARRQAVKLVSTYLDHFLELSERDGRIHPSINTVGGTRKNPFEPGGSSGVRTGRMSMNDPNLQNVPIRTKEGKRVRRCFIPGEGRTWVKCDADQIEMRLLAHLTNEPRMIEAFVSEGDFFVNMARDLFADPDFQKSDPRRSFVKNCVPLTTEILTRRGWLKHDDVQIGDETLGYDVETRKTRWTKITAIHHYNDAEIVILGNHDRSFEVTPGHRWLVEHERNHSLTFLSTSEFSRSGYRAILAADCAEGTALISDHEAAVLGWVLSDGSIRRGKFVDAPSQAHGRKVACHVEIGQVKPDRVIEIDALLATIPHRRSTRTREGKIGVCWTLDPTWSRDVLTRAVIHDKYTFDPWQVALQLTPSARRAMIETLNAGDGGHRKHSYISIAQAHESAVSELVVALGYLTGHFSRVYVKQPTGRGWTKNPCDIINYQKPTMTGQRTSTHSSTRQDVWCVTTELGTWTMRQDRTPVLTGNSGYAKIYGAGTDKFAKTAGVPFDEAFEFMRRFDALYPAVPTWIRRVERLGNERLEAEGVAYVRSPLTGRRHVADAGRLYTLVNYLIQGTAGEILKLKMVEADQAGLSEYMTLPVHDEIDADVPTSELDDFITTLRDVVNDDQLLRLPLTWSIETGTSWGECS